MIPVALFLIAFVVALWFDAPWWVLVCFALGSFFSAAMDE